MDRRLVGCDAAQSCRWLLTLLRNVACRLYASPLSMEAICSLEVLTSYKTTRQETRKDHNVYFYRRKNLKLHLVKKSNSVAPEPEGS
jgi:hypothetical protein